MLPAKWWATIKCPDPVHLDSITTKAAACLRPKVGGEPNTVVAAGGTEISILRTKFNNVDPAP